jgi:hypothetical protein
MKVEIVLHETNMDTICLELTEDNFHIRYRERWEVPMKQILRCAITDFWNRYAKSEMTRILKGFQHERQSEN